MNEELILINSLSKDHDRMRPSLIPSILNSVALNQKTYNNFSLFELGRSYLPDSKKFLRDIIEDTNAFLTSGCPGCNRPYYTSRPSGPIYNYPRKLTIPEKDDIYELLERFLL